MRFTQESIAALVCPKGQKDKLVFDGHFAGFGCRVTDGGTKTFLAQYNLGSIKRRMPIGKFGEITVKQARDRALSILGDARAGGDPFGEAKARVAKAEADTIAARVKAREEAFTLSDLIEAWERDRTKAGRRSGYLVPAVASLRRHLEDWLSRPAASITESEATRRIQQIEGDAGPMASNRALSYARACYGRGGSQSI
jgi:hypothetical protein